MLAGALLGLIACVVLFYAGWSFFAWTLGVTIFLAAWSLIDGGGWSWWVCASLLALAACVFGIPVIRRLLITPAVFAWMKPLLPRLGESERIALEAGTVWWDGELFSGMPDFGKLLEMDLPVLNSKEQAFLDGPTAELCRHIDDWEITQQRRIPDEIWDFLKNEGFFGMVIPEEYDGKGFSAIAHSMVVTRLASRSIPVAVTTMVPNSLGPAELLLHYGTEEQKRHYLPRLASGEEIPCFALTGPEAGSDAAATQSEGIVCRGTFRGEEVLGMRLSWNKRYISLAPVATLIGLAFRLKDPDGLLGPTEDLGITCALIPADTEGVLIGDRHDPMGIPFANGPIYGTDVFVPLDTIIGGVERAGQGWRMLMESLAAGRGVSLPSLSVGAIQLCTRVVGAYATVREQFDTPIGRFEGIEEALARIAAYAYFGTATRTLTCGALDLGEQPPVVSAIVKAYLTEGMRQVVSDAMDIRAGAAIQRGPRNILARVYQAVPIGITVEGSNILTRSMIIYGQGAIRCHPHVQDEIEAIAEDDLKRFDHAFFGHVSMVARNTTRALLLGLTDGRLAKGHVNSDVAPYFRQLSRLSAGFVLTSDAAMAVLGGKLKRKEKLSGRLADALAWMYMASAALKRYADEPHKQDDLPMVRYSCEKALYEVEDALAGIYDNFPNRPVAWLLKAIVFPLGRTRKVPDDRLGASLARAVLEDREDRERLTRDIFVPPANEKGLGMLEEALDQAVIAHRIETKIRDAVREGRIDRAPGDIMAREALAQGIIVEDEFEVLRSATSCRHEVIQVDSFTPYEYRNLHG